MSPLEGLDRDKLLEFENLVFDTASNISCVLAKINELEGRRIKTGFSQEERRGLERTLADLRRWYDESVE